ncbi:MAG: cytochrome ubiquinol oxidase subunit I, partial [Tepidiformaceae bacterium]
MDAETLSRIQFAFTVSFHFIFPPLSMGLGMMLIAFGIAYVRTKAPKWRQLSFFWTQIYGLIFALGVATGVVQEFEFGMNWANYSRFVGNVFGSLLAAEGVFAFFLEGGFLGLMLFGGNRLGPRMWLTATCVVVFAAHFSAVWIVMANSWMQTPDGYKLVGSGSSQQAEMTSFVDVMLTSSFIPHILHVIVASWMAGAALVLSVSAWYILKKRHIELAESSFKLALPWFAVLSILQLVLFGANQAIQVTNDQPVKLAAMEGVWNDQSCAPMYLVGWVDESAQTTRGISIPCLLSFLADGNKDATVQGLNSFPEDTWPSVNLTFQVYHLMIDLAGFFGL